MRLGRYAALEGVEASGKSTQARLLAASIGAILTREPGATPLGGQLRQLVLDPAPGRMDPRTEALLLAADRAAHVSEVVRPALQEGRDVVSDRSVGSFLAYQGFGRRLPIDELHRLSDWASSGLWPDLIVLIDVPLAEAESRLNVAGRRLDRLEGEGHEFHRRVHAGYRELAASDPRRWVAVDGTGDIDTVARRVLDAWTARFG